MSDLLWKLLNSPTLGPSQEGVELGLTLSPPAWAWVLIVAGAATIGWLGYRRLEGSARARWALGVLRTITVVMLAVLVCQPRLSKAHETTEPDWVLMLVDRSASLSVTDALGGDNGERISRDAQLRRALDAAREPLRKLGEKRVVAWMGFDASAYELARATGGTPVPPGADEADSAALGEPAGRRTDIGRAIEQALKRAAARPVAGVVVISDGRSAEPPSGALVRRLQAEKVPVFTLALGSKENLPDLSIKSVEAPRTGFVKDAVPVRVEVERSGTAPAGSEETAVVELVDVDTGAVMDTQTVTWDAPTPGASAGEQAKRLTLTSTPGAVGRGQWRVRIRPSGSLSSGPSSGAGEMVADNNASDFAIEMLDRPLRVAYFDGYPRWEYRYIKNLLVREQSVSSAIMLLAAGRKYLQEGTVVLDTLPRTAEEWAKFDVVILGDVGPGVFTDEQLALLKLRVSVGGAGLIFIGGEGATPGVWRGGPLADLLPFGASASGGGASGMERVARPVTLSPTPAAERLGVMRLSEQADAKTNMYWPGELSDPGVGWSQLQFMQRIDPATIKTATETLALAHEVGGGDSSPSSGWPAVLSMRFGQGRVIYVATDEIWRWRYGRGERLPERFWIQMVRLLGRESVSRSGRPAILEVLPERAQVDQPVRVQLTLIDQALVENAPASVKVRLRPAGQEADASAAVELTLTPDDAGRSVSGESARIGATRTLSGTWVPTRAGRYVAETNDPGLVGASGEGVQTRVEVWQADDEMRRPQTDHALLAELSNATGGKVMTPSDLSKLAELLPNRSLTIAGEPETHTLWDTPLALLIMLLLLTAEWVGRRLLRLA